MPANLNTLQQSAAYSVSPVIIINAGPGTGKTKTLISRIVYLIQEKTVDPSNIFAITFTKKAAAEMKERLRSSLSDITMPFIGTFHALAHSVLSKENEISIATEKQIDEILEDLSKKPQFVKISKKDAVRIISLYKSQITTNQKKPKTFESIEEDLVKAYNDSLESQNLMDYDDILLEFYELLQNTEKFQTLQNQCHHILVDEFQDTNEIQYEIIKKLTPHSLFIIGDPLQSIYSFRGADSNIFGRATTDFPDALSIKLSTNYRSAHHIIHVSSLLFPSTQPLQPHRKLSGSVSLIHTFHEYSEADYVLKKVGELVGGIDLLESASIADHSDTICFSDVAVIYRNHRVSTSLQDRFFNSGIPFQVVGEKNPYEQVEVQFLIDCLQYLYFRTDEYRSIFENNQIIKSHIDIESLLTIAEKNTVLSNLIQKIAQHFGLFERLKDKKEALRNLMQFQTTMSQFDSSKNSLADAVEYIQFLNDHEFYDPDCDKVTLLTIHASKGLEFKHVFICGFEDEIIPGKREDVNLEEEKRLLYVAMTRAKDSLTLLRARNRNKKSTSVSRFKYILPTDVIIEKEDSATEIIAKKIEKAKIKKSQIQLF